MTALLIECWARKRLIQQLLRGKCLLRCHMTKDYSKEYCPQDWTVALVEFSSLREHLRENLREDFSNVGREEQPCKAVGKAINNLL